MVRIAAGKRRKPLVSGVKIVLVMIAGCLMTIFILLQQKLLNSKANVLNPDDTDTYTSTRARTTTSTSISRTDTKKKQPLRKGWKSIDVFFGDSKDGHIGSRGKSQCGQDDLVMALLKDKYEGYFVDLAANAAVNLSNTYQLEEKLDWGGICIEPNPRYWRSLSHRQCHVAGAVVGKERMEEVKYRMYNDLWRRAASGGIEEFIDPNIPKGEEMPTLLYTVPIEEILEKYNAPSIMDYLSLDIEGAEYMVMSHFPFTKYRFRVMTIERPSQDMVNLLYDNGYLYIGGNNEDGEETVWTHRYTIDDLDRSGLEKVGWIGGKSTKWVTLNDVNPLVKPTVNDWRVKG